MRNERYLMKSLVRVNLYGYTDHGLQKISKNDSCGRLNICAFETISNKFKCFKWSSSLDRID